MNEPKGVNIQLVVVSSSAQHRVLNLETMQGMDKELFAFGFTENGLPCQNPNDPIHYKFVGGFCGGVNLNHVFKYGVTTPSGTLRNWDAIANLLQRAGCDISPKEVEREITKLLKEKVSKIFCYRVCWSVGLKESYGLFQDGWLFSAAKPETDDVDLDEINKMLKNLKPSSPWRILTEKSLQVLRKSEFSKLLKTSDL